MTGNVGEAVSQQGTPLQSALDAGVKQISESQTIQFTLFKKIVSPLDGFVFWCRADTLSANALGNTSRFNTFQFNQPQLTIVPASNFLAPGSLHKTTTNTQGEAESFSLRRMIFTSTVEVDFLDDVASDELWCAELDDIKFAFSSRSMFYEQSGLYHYAGDALYPTHATQVLDDPSGLRLDNIVVSNSLPIWLQLNNLFPVYNSYLVPDNIFPPYAAVQIGEGDTTPLSAASYVDKTGSRWQLMKDRVRVTMFGVRNDAALDFIEQVGQYTLNNPGVMGLMNTPALQDAKRGQTEFSVLAQKKTVIFEVSYYQLRAQNLARQLIKSAFIEDFMAQDLLQLYP